MPKMEMLICLDRDGTLIHDPGYFGKDDDWRDKLRLMEGVPEGMRLLAGIGNAKIIVATNQSGIANLQFSIERACKVNREIHKRVAAAGGRIDSWQVSAHVSREYAGTKGLEPGNPWVVNDSDPRLRLRKPGTGMIEKAVLELGHGISDFGCIIVIGDSTTDIETAARLGAEAFFIRNSRNAVEALKAEKMIRDGHKASIADDFLEAARLVVQKAGSSQKH